jgi:hypothetical protein
MDGMPTGVDLLWIGEVSGQSSFTLPKDEEQATAQVGSYFLIPIPMKPKVVGRIETAAASDRENLILQ